MPIQHPPCPSLLWDVFCRVVDNFGDIGVCWRLARNLAARGQQVRLWVDDASALQWMAPGALQGAFGDTPDNTSGGISVHPWAQAQQAQAVAALPMADVWVEAFGCEIAPEFVAACAHFMRSGGQIGTQAPVWINLEYLSAEAYVERCHTLPSPVLHGSARGWVKHFFYPGFTPETGGLLRELDLDTRRDRFDRRTWLAQTGLAWAGERLVSLFCYEPAALPALLHQWATDSTPTRLLVTHGRTAAAVSDLCKNWLQSAPDVHGALSISYLPALRQDEFDHLLWACDLNLVRGEDSLVRALWAEKPFVWQIYPQHDQAHHAKLTAFLDMLEADAALRQFHFCWNGMADASPTLRLGNTDLHAWQSTVATAAKRLRAQPDLACQLLRFVQETR